MNHLETIDIKQQENSISTTFKRSTEVTIDNTVQDSLYDSIEKDLKQVNPKIIVGKADLSQQTVSQAEQANQNNFKQFKTLYFLAKSKKLERHLAGSSVS